MPYPYQISSSAVLDDRQASGAGPYLYGTSLYVVLIDRGTLFGPHQIEIWRSIDDGVTWAEVDSANHPNVFDSAYDNTCFYSVVRSSDDKLHILARYDTSTGALGIRVFDLALNAWTATAIGGGPIPADYPAHSYGGAYSTFFLALMSTGAYRVVYENKHQTFGNWYQDSRYQSYSGGSWDTEAYVVGNATATYNTVPLGIYTDSSDRVHIIIGAPHTLSFTTTATVYSVTILSDGTKGAAAYSGITIPYNNVNEAGAGCTYIDENSREWIAIPLRSYEGNSAPLVLRAPVSALLLWKVEAVTLDYFGFVGKNSSLLFYTDNALYLFWAGLNLTSGAYRIFKLCCKSALQWADDDPVETITSGGATGVLSQPNGSYIGIVFIDPTIDVYPRYTRYTPTCTAPGCGGSDTGCIYAGY